MLGLLVGGGVTVPGPADAQWVEPPGEGWLSVTLYHQDTRERFDSEARERPFFNGGHAVTSALYVTAALGVVEGVDVWAQVPVLRLQFDDAARQRDRAGIGDVRLFARTAPLRAFGLSWPVAVRGGVKLPVLGRLGARLQVEGLEGRAPEIEGVTLASARRELVEITPVVSWAVGPGSVEAGVRIPVHGRNLPAGETVLVGYFADLRLF